MSILDVFDAHPWFRGGADWLAWRAFLAASHGLPMSDEEYAIFCECTGRKDPPTRQVDEAWVICGRRARKSAVGSFIGCYHAAYRDYEVHLAPGESARILLMAKDLDEAAQMHSYSSAILTDPSLEWMLAKSPKADEIHLTNRTHLKIRAAKITGGRSRAIAVALLDEIAFFPNVGSAHSDEEIIRGIRNAMSNIPAALLLCMSSPYAERGELYRAYLKYYGVELPDILVWKAPTLRMHKTKAIVAFVAKEYKKDVVAANAEVGAEFRKDVLTFIPREAVMACVVKGRRALPPCDLSKVADPSSYDKPRFNYWAFVDTTGGTSDSFSVAIAHWDPEIEAPGGAKGKAVLDFVREWKPDPQAGKLSPEETTKKVAEEIKRFGLDWCTGDAYAGEWPRERFAKNGIRYQVSTRTKHEIYKQSLPALNSGRVELLDDEKLIDQLCDLDRRVTPQGKEIIDHPPNGHDDLINAAAGALLEAYNHGQYMEAPVAEEAPAKTTAEIVERELRESAKEISLMGREEVRDESLGDWQGWD
jgi:hypothetical protein